MASYRGSPFEAGIGPTDDDIVLFAACPPPEELGFEPATGHWRKQLRIADVQAVWESRPVGIFRGERCMVLDDLGDRLHIGYLGHDGYKAEQLGYWQVDRGVFELVAPRTEVSEILEERSDYPRGTATSGLGNGQLAPEPGYPHSGAHSILPSPQAGLSGPHQTLSGPHTIAPGLTRSAEPTRSVEASRPIEPTGPTLSGQQTPSEHVLSDHARSEHALADEMLSGQPAVSPEYLDSWADAPRRPLETRTQNPAAPGSYLPPPGPELYPGQPASPYRGYPDVPSYPAEIPVPTGSLDSLAYRPVVDDTTGVALPLTSEAPLPVEAEAMRAASASRRPRQPTAHGRNGIEPADRPAAPPARVMQTPEPAMQAPQPAIQAPQIAIQAPEPTRQARSTPTTGSRPVSGLATGQPGESGLAGEPGLAAEPGLAGEPGPIGGPGRAAEPGLPELPGRGRAAAEPLGPGGGAPQHIPPLYVVPDPVSSPAQLGPTQQEPAQLRPSQLGLPQAELAQPGPAHSTASSRQRRAARRRMATERLFADLASQAGIPADTYAVGEEVEGAMCLIQTDSGFEVFHSADGARHELQVFATEESACFYLFGVLAAEAVRTGSLVRLPAVRT